MFLLRNGYLFSAPAPLSLGCYSFSSLCPSADPQLHLLCLCLFWFWPNPAPTLLLGPVSTSPKAPHMPSGLSFILALLFPFPILLCFSSALSNKLNYVVVLYLPSLESWRENSPLESSLRGGRFVCVIHYSLWCPWCLEQHLALKGYTLKWYRQDPCVERGRWTKRGWSQTWAQMRLICRCIDSNYWMFEMLSLC